MALNVKIAGWGHYLPQHLVANADLEREFHIPSGWIDRITGVRQRHYAGEETVVEMAAQASRRALEASGLRPSDLDAIIGASASPYQAIPCTAAFVQRSLNAPEGLTSCFDVNATCLSFLFALRTAAHLVASGAHRAVLVFSSEKSAHSRNSQQWESATLFGDAAAAAVVVPSGLGEASCFGTSKFSTFASGAELTEFRGGGTRHHPNDPSTTSQMNLFAMEGQAVLKMAARKIGPFFEAFYRESGSVLGDYDLVIPHQASRYGLEMLWGRFGIPEEKVFQNLANRGNCIAASLPLAFSEAVAQGRVVRGSRVLMMGSGAGLTLGAFSLVY